MPRKGKKRGAKLVLILLAPVFIGWVSFPPLESGKAWAGEPGKNQDEPSLAINKTSGKRGVNTRKGRIRKAGGRLAIVIDDMGHNLRRPKDFLALGLPINFSILPGLNYSRQAARLISAAGREYLIHLPMEPFAYPRINPGPMPLLLNQNKGFTRNRMKAILAGLPGAIGASNHMGSAYTYDAEKMGVVQRMVADKRLFFLNSKTSTSPVPGEIARSKGYPYLERDVFLDNERGLSFVRAQLKKAVALARTKGRAIAIGHPLPETYRAIRNMFSARPPQGVRLVPLSQLVGK